MKKIFLLATVTFLQISISTAYAEFRQGAFTTSPLIGGYIFEGDQGLQQHNFTISAELGYTLTKHIGIEGTFNYIYSRSDSGEGTVNGYLYRVDGLYHFNPSGKLVPFLAAGFGGITLNPDHGESHTHAVFDYGAGVQYFVTENVALRGEVRHLLTLGEVENNFMYMGGVTFYMGGEQTDSHGQ